MTETPRQHLRLPLDSTVFIETMSASLGGREGAEIAMCKTLDVSTRGIRVALQQELAEGAILQVGVVSPGVDDPECLDTFYLAGQVRWCRPGEDSRYPFTAGFELLDAGDSDIERWVDLISQFDD